MDGSLVGSPTWILITEPSALNWIGSLKETLDKSNRYNAKYEMDYGWGGFIGSVKILRNSSSRDDVEEACTSPAGFFYKQKRYAATPRTSAGDLTVMRSRMVGNAHFEAISNRIGLTQLMEIGSGMARGEVKGKMVADMFEAVIGALFSEGGADAVMKFWRACKV